MKLLFSKKYILILLLFSLKLNAFSLEVNDTTLNYGTIESGAYKRLTILPTGIFYEMMGNKKNSIILSAQIDQNIGGGYVKGHFLFYYLIQPKFNIEYRFYYNKNKRENKKRRTDFRSLNYLGILSENRGDQYPIYVFYQVKVSTEKVIDKKFFHHEVSYIGPVYGIQRSIGKRKRMYWSGEIGIGYNISKNKIRTSYEQQYADWEIIGDFFSIGIIL